MADIVLGWDNGFDLDLGLKSKYINFAKSYTNYTILNS